MIPHLAVFHSQLRITSPLIKTCQDLIRMKLLLCAGGLWFLCVSLAHAHVDICNTKLKDLSLMPACVYRNPNPEGHADDQEKPPESTNPRVWELSKANGRFALSLFRQLSQDRPDNGNIFMSPLSVSTAFAMTKLGACNTTLQQIMKVFEFDTIKEKTSDQVHFFFAKLNCRLYRKKHDSVELISANRLFGEKSLTFNETYQNISEVVYGAKLMPLNFKEKPELSRQKINQWISERTNRKINDTLPQGSVDTTTVLVLVNTIYFKGQWKHKFNTKDVMLGDFHMSNTEKCPVHMMYQENKFRYGKFDGEVSVLELPYSGEGISMVLVLPDYGRELSEVVANLTLSKLNGWLNKMQVKTVAVHIPRFHIEDSFSLKKKLQAMGLEHIFSGEHASLPGMVEDVTEGLYVSDAFHKASLEVNEEGSEAAAATAVVFLGRSLNLNREHFTANRPFLLFIRETTINALIFAGRVSNPCNTN